MSVAEVDLITQFRAMMFKHYPFISHYVYALTPVPKPGLGTMAVDQQGFLYYDPEWCETLTLEEGGYVAVHEAFHLILRHCQRAKQILGNNPTEQQRYNFNIAADIVVWECMESVADLAPEGGVTLANAQEQWPDIEPNMTLTQLYNIINHKEDQDEQESGIHIGNYSGLSGTRTDGEQSQAPGKPSQDTGNGSMDSDAPRQMHPDESREGSLQVEEHGYRNVDKGSAADGQNRDYESEHNPNWELYIEEQLLEQCEKQIQEIKDDPNRSKVAGNVAGRFERYLKQTLHPPVNVWNKLRDVIATNLSTNAGYRTTTYRKRNRRQAALPSNTILAGENRHKANAVVIMDTSGSMTRKCLSKCAATCYEGVRAVGSFRLVCWDYELQADLEVKHAFTDWPAPGGGGTCMVRAIKYVLDNPKHYGNPDVIICCTDGGTGWPDQEDLPRRCKLVIALTQDERTPSWAQTIKIPDIGKITEEDDEV